MISVKIMDFLKKTDILIQKIFNITGFIVSTLVIVFLMVILFGVPALLSFGLMKIKEYFDIKWEKRVERTKKGNK